MLVAIAIPVFTAALHNSKAATDEANARSLYADLQADYLADGSSDYSGATWTGAPASGTDITGEGTTFTLSDGEEIALADSDTTITPTFHEGEGWSVHFVDTKNSVDTTWGIQ